MASKDFCIEITPRQQAVTLNDFTCTISRTRVRGVMETLSECLALCAGNPLMFSRFLHKELIMQRLVSWLLSWMSCCTINQIASDLRCFKAHMTFYDCIIWRMYASAWLYHAISMCHLTHWGGDIWTTFRRWHFQMKFLEWKYINFD